MDWQLKAGFVGVWWCLKEVSSTGMQSTYFCNKMKSCSQSPDWLTLQWAGILHILMVDHWRRCREGTGFVVKGQNTRFCACTSPVGARTHLCSSCDCSAGWSMCFVEGRLWKRSTLPNRASGVIVRTKVGHPQLVWKHTKQRLVEVTMGSLLWTRT